MGQEWVEYHPRGCSSGRVPTSAVFLDPYSASICISFHDPHLASCIVPRASPRHLGRRAGVVGDPLGFEVSSTRWSSASPCIAHWPCHKALRSRASPRGPDPTAPPPPNDRVGSATDGGSNADDTRFCPGLPGRRSKPGILGSPFPRRTGKQNRQKTVQAPARRQRSPQSQPCPHGG